MDNNQLVPFPSATFAPIGPAAQPPAAAFSFFKGVDWPMLIVLFDPTTRAPLQIPDDTTFTADLFFANSSVAALTLTLDNNGLRAIDRVNSTVLLVAPQAVTANARVLNQGPKSLAALPGYVPGYGASQAPPLDNRVVLYAVSGSGIRQPAAVLTINVGDLRSVDPAYFQENQVAQAVASITQVSNDNVVLRTAQFKRAMNAWQAGSVDAMFGSGVFQANEGDPGYITWRDDIAPPGGAFEQLVTQWLVLAAPGAGMTPVQAAQQIVALRNAAAGF